ncbi:MAG: FkbM family methyltransferase [Spirochaetaceae bacterium]|nr:MAG: FkbM family methyltransferase [Spirochaetaceae bacterium]
MKPHISRLLKRWSRYNTIGAVLVLMAATMPFIPASGIISALAAWGVLSFGGLLLTGVKAQFSVKNAANILSTLRVLLTVAGSLALLRVHGGGGTSPSLAASLAPSLAAYSALGLFLAAQLTDFLDGLAARIHGPTAFGGRLDEEVDAFFVAALSVVLHRFFGLGPWILLTGALRYLYLPSLVLIPEAPKRSSAYTWFAKTACAVAVGGLILLTAPFLPAALRVPVAGLVLATLLVSFGWAWLGNLRAAFPSYASLRGTLQSFMWYYAVPFRHSQQRAFYRRIISSADGTIYDLGAHLGSRTRVFLELGLPVVAVEPQERFFRIMETSLANRPHCTLIHGAVGAAAGTAEIQISDRNPTVSSLSLDWISTATSTGVLEGVTYNRSETVRLYTIHELTDKYGPPAFIKIDVEGFEYEVIRGLSVPVPALSFEIVPSSFELTKRCVEHLEELGRYRYHFTPAERTRFVESEPWSAQRLLEYLENVSMPDRNGDIYAFLTGTPHDLR